MALLNKRWKAWLAFGGMNFLSRAALASQNQMQNNITKAPAQYTKFISGPVATAAFVTIGLWIGFAYKDKPKEMFVAYIGLGIAAYVMRGVAAEGIEFFNFFKQAISVL